jgi:hypothetical protein
MFISGGLLCLFAIISSISRRFGESLEVKLPRIWTDGKAEVRKSQGKEDAGARKGRKVAIHCVFPWICGSGGSKSRLTKAAGAERSGQKRDEKLIKVAPRCGAKHIFRSQNVQSSSASERF